MRHQARSYAIQALYQSEILETKSMVPADNFLNQLETSEEARIFARELVEGTLRHRKHLDRYLRRNLEHWKLNRLSTIVRCILRLAAYELYHQPELSHSVVINEAIELCKDFVDETSHGLVNRVLQRVYDEILTDRKKKAEKGNKPVEESPEKTPSSEPFEISEELPEESEDFPEESEDLPEEEKTHVNSNIWGKRKK